MEPQRTNYVSIRSVDNGEFTFYKSAFIEPKFKLKIYFCFLAYSTITGLCEMACLHSCFNLHS